MTGNGAARVWETVRADAQRWVDERLADRRAVHVLEAGCGSAAHLAFPSGARVTGIDLSERQLSRNAAVHEKIVGDIETFPLHEEAYDLVVCWDVLEHLPHPELALENLARALKQGGVLVLAFPNASSLKALVARATPFAFHVWLYRNVIGSRHAGSDEVGPFPTRFGAAMHLPAVESRLRARGLRPVGSRLYESIMQEHARLRLHLTGRAWDAFRRGVDAVSRGRLSADLTDCLLVYEKA